MRHFLLMGLPRSRTAWLSNFFTVGKVYCHHDLSWQVESDPTDFADALRGPEVAAEASGAADSGAIFFLDQILVELPKLIPVYIRRDLGECIKSMAVAVEEPEEVVRPIMVQCYEALEDRCFEHQFRFEDLDDETVVRDLWEIVAGGIPFPAVHFEKCVRQKIVLKPGFLVDVKLEAMKEAQ